MREVCLVFTWKREPLLWLCLEAIRKAEPDLQVAVWSDRGATSPELTGCCDSFKAELIVIQPHKFYGNSFNTLGAMELTLRSTNNYDVIHTVEDDTIVHPDWFKWASARMANGNDAACARIQGDPATMWYESPAASWNAGSLRKCLELLPLDYFSETREGMIRAVDNCEHFRQSRYRYGSAEQDGFFLRCVEKLKLRTIFPTVSLAQHIGFYGYNRPPGAPRPEGQSFDDQVAFCRRLLRDRQRRTELFGQRVTSQEMGNLPE